MATISRPASEPSSSEQGQTTERHSHQILARTSLIGMWAALFIFYAIVEPHTFLQSGTLKTIFGSQFELVFLGLALICTFVVGEFDLSIASIMGLSATLVPLLVVQDGWSPILATVVAILAAGAVGVINGILVVRIGVNPIVATLGMSTFVLGITLWISDLNAINGLSQSYAKLSTREIFGLPAAFYYALIAALVLAYVLGMTPLGRRMAFVGSSREVARLAGVNVDRIRFGAYVASALICGVAGVLLTSSLGGFDPNSSTQYLLPAFASVFLGTAVIQPGRFNPIGTVVAVYFLQTGIVGLELLGLTGWVEDVFYGGALVIAISAATLIGNRTAS